MSQLSVIVDPLDTADIDAAIDQLIAIKNRLLGHAALKEATGMEYYGVNDLSGRYAAVDARSTAQAALDDLWPRLGVKLQKLMKAAATLPQPYTTADLAQALGTDTATAKSWRANLGRSLNAVMKNHPDARPFFEQHAQPGGGWHYSLSPDYRPLIKSRDLRESADDRSAPRGTSRKESA